MYPHMIPNVISEAVTFQKAAASPQTLIFMLIVVGTVIPIILIYTSYEFWVFRGKVDNYYKKDMNKKMNSWSFLSFVFRFHHRRS